MDFDSPLAKAANKYWYWNDPHFQVQAATYNQIVIGNAMSGNQTEVKPHQIDGLIEMPGQKKEANGTSFGSSMSVAEVQERMRKLREG